MRNVNPSSQSSRPDRGSPPSEQPGDQWLVPLPRWGRPKQWYLVGAGGATLSIGAAALAGIPDLPAVIDFLIRPLASIGLSALFGGIGIGVTKSRLAQGSETRKRHETGDRQQDV